MIDAQYDADSRTARFDGDWTYAQIRNLEGALTTQHFSVRVISPLRMDLQMNARNRGTFLTKEMTAALQEAGALKVTSFGAGSYEIWAPMYYNSIEFVRTMQSRVDKLNVDVEVRSHDVIAFQMSRGAAGYADRGGIYAALAGIKEVLCVEIDGGHVRLLAKLGAVKKDKIKAALATAGFEMKEPEPAKK